MRYALCLLSTLLLLPTWASEPGNPLDCSDWVFLEPGLSCTPWVPYPCEESENSFFCADSGLIIFESTAACGFSPLSVEPP